MEDKKNIISENLALHLYKDKNREYLAEELIPKEESDVYFVDSDNSPKPPSSWVYAYVDGVSRYKKISFDPNATLEEIQISLLSKQTKDIRIIKNIFIAILVIAVVAGILGAIGSIMSIKDLASIFY